MSLAESTIEVCRRCNLTREQHRLVETPDGPIFQCIKASERDEDPERAEIPWQASDTLESWDRTFEKLEDRRGLALQFTRAAIEVLRLVDRHSTPEAWQQVVDDLHTMGRRHGLADAVLQTLMASATTAPRDARPGKIAPATASESPYEPPLVDSLDAYDEGPAEDPPNIAADQAKTPFNAITPAAWQGTEPIKQKFLASARIPCGDLTILTGNGGSGKTETALQLLIYVAAALVDWLGCTIEAGLALFLTCEEPEHNIRDRVERICKHRSIDPHYLTDLYLVFPELDATWLAHVARDGRLTRAPLLDWLEAWIKQHKPRLVVIDSIAAVFDGDAIARRQVRGFLAMLRKIAREHDVAIVLLDHPSVRGMADGTGTANSVDWRNSVRSMLHLSDPDKDDPDVRTLTVTKSNYGRTGEKVTLRWNGLTFTTATAGETSSYRAAADRDVDDLFLRLLDRFSAQGRAVRPSTGRGSAPAEMADEPDTGGVKAEAFRAAMVRLMNAGKIRIVESGPPSKRVKHIERVS
jgi:RecA-family ATPase